MPGVPPTPSPGPSRSSDVSDESAAPPHAERPDAATASPSPRRRLGRSARLAAVVVALAATGAGCKSIFGSTPKPAVAPAAAAAASQAAPVPGTPPLEHWHALAQCETGSRWDAPGPTYVGGLGMYAPNWAAYGGLQYAPSADLATPEQQIAVATNLWLAGGSWGCRIGDGWDRR